MTFTIGDTRLPDRFWSKVSPGGDPKWPLDMWAARGLTAGSCWEWTGSQHGLGYGFFWSGGRSQRSHRIAYEALAGPIPEGLFLDHLCRNTACCNPDHLEPVTNAENVRRGIFPARRAHDGTCPNGHDLTDDNLVKSKLPARICLECTREYSRSYSKVYHQEHKEQRSDYARRYNARIKKRALAA